MQVSILTVTQLNRFNSLKLLFEYIQNQTYKNIVEWIILDGSTTIEDKQANEILINELIQNNPNILYRKTDLNITLDKENVIKSVNYMKGDILVCMDDDDYYFPSFIEHCVSKLYSSSNLIAGSDSIYIHDIILQKTFKSNVDIIKFAYKKEYIINNNINNNIEKLIAEYLIVKIVHENNHFFNKSITCNASMIQLEKIYLLEDEIINYLIPSKYYLEYKNIFVNNVYLDYDIVYLLGGFGISWSPHDTNLGGSEQAVIKLSEEWVNSGKKVCVYGNFNNDAKLNGVDYLIWNKFPFAAKKIKNLIVWRKSGILTLLNNSFTADNTIIDFHDNMFVFNDMNKEILINFFNKINYFHLKSDYHKNYFKNYFDNKIDDNKLLVMANGIRIDDFSINKYNVLRNPKRFCFCSSYDRSLAEILKFIWPIIYKADNHAELHLYYGMDYIFDENFKNYMYMLIGSTKGVMDHGRQPMDAIIREKYLSTFHLYISNTEAETDCINVRESLVANCIPIISDFGVFKERHGLQYNINSDLSEETCKIIANDIINKMNDKDFIDRASYELLKSNTIISWKDISLLWLKYLN